MNWLDQWAYLKERFAARSPREKRLIAAGAVVLLAIVFYTALWSPWRQSLERLRREVPAAREQLAWMRAALPRLEALRARRPNSEASASAPPPRAATAQAAAEQWLAELRPSVERIRLETPDTRSVRVIFEKILFDELLTGLESLESKTGLELQSIEITRTAVPGRVDARLGLHQP
jgi:general secretion pathway protein M